MAKKVAWAIAHESELGLTQLLPALFMIIESWSSQAVRSFNFKLKKKLMGVFGNNLFRFGASPKHVPVRISQSIRAMPRRQSETCEARQSSIQSICQKMRGS